MCPSEHRWQTWFKFPHFHWGNQHCWADAMCQALCWVFMGLGFSNSIVGVTHIILLPVPLDSRPNARRKGTVTWTTTTAASTTATWTETGNVTESLTKIRYRISFLHGSISSALRTSRLQRHYYDNPQFTAGKTETQWLHKETTKRERRLSGTQIPSLSGFRALAYNN